MRMILCLLTLLTVLWRPSHAFAQSLADVAKAEEARRKTVKEPSKVYTNDDLKGFTGNSIPAPSSPAPATSATPPADGKAGDPAKPAAPNADEPKKDEKYWHDRIAATRDALAHDKVLADALQSRINALTRDFANTDDPAQRALVEQNRKTALAELDRITKDTEKQTKALADVQEEARKANVPPGWLR